MTLGRITALTYVVAALLMGLLTLGRPPAHAGRVTLATVEAAESAERDRVAPLPSLEAEVARLEARWQDEKLILPWAELATEEKLITAIQRACDASTVQLTEVVLNGFPKQPAPMRGGFERVGVTVKLVGSYGSLVKLIAHLESEPSSNPWLEVASFSITRPEKPASGDLGATLEVVTYRPPAR